MDGPIRFKSFTYYPDRGELVRQDGQEPESVSRLAPQPNKLLILLLENYPGIVSQEAIKAAIWPEVQVEFEKSLHYCIRQIRSALNDSASQPEYIETIPRRGYRWVAGWESASRSTTVEKGRIAFPKIVLIALALIPVLLYFLGTAAPTRSSGQKDTLRVAIMSFQPEGESHPFAGNDIALQLVDLLTNQHRNTLEVIGPTTTVNYDPHRLQALIEDFAIDVVLNGRFALADSTGRLLAEVIRADDGAHVWVKYYEAGAESRDIADAVHRGLQQHFPVE